MCWLQLVSEPLEGSPSPCFPLSRKLRAQVGMGIGGGGVPVLVSRLGFLVLGMRVPVLLPLWVRVYYCLSSSVLS